MNKIKLIFYASVFLVSSFVGFFVYDPTVHSTRFLKGDNSYSNNVKSISVEMVEQELKQATEEIKESDNTNETKGYPMFEYEVTAYCSCKKCCGKNPGSPGHGVTAAGTKVKKNHTIAAGKNLPLGTQVVIEGYPYIYTVEDRGGAITENRIDIYMETHQKALDFGRKKLKVWIINIPN